MLDFLSLPSLNQDADEADLTEEELAEREAQAKKDRIAFHREHVRNGPAKFRHVTPGQAKRQRRRDLARQTRKAQRAQRRAFISKVQEHALLRGQLQAVGVIAYETDFRPSEEARFNAARWILTHYGSDDIENLGDDDSNQSYLRDALQAAFDRFSDLSGVERSEVEYAGA